MAGLAPTPYRAAASGRKTKLFAFLFSSSGKQPLMERSAVCGNALVAGPGLPRVRKITSSARVDVASKRSEVPTPEEQKGPNTSEGIEQI
jgi:hypothetical protein